MTPQEHDKITLKLCDAIYRKRGQAKRNNLTLADKLAILAEVKELEEQLRQHRLNYFVLTTGAERIV